MILQVLQNLHKEHYLIQTVLENRKEKNTPKSFCEVRLIFTSKSDKVGKKSTGQSQS